MEGYYRKMIKPHNKKYYVLIGIVTFVVLVLKFINEYVAFILRSGNLHRRNILKKSRITI